MVNATQTSQAGAFLVKFNIRDIRLELDIERCKQDMVDVETIKKTLLAFDKVINILPIEDQKELFQLLFKEIRVWSFDSEKEKTPQERGVFITNIRTKWYKIRLNLYQLPDIDRYYESLSKKKASSDFNSNWLPVVDDVRTRIIQNNDYFHVPDLKMIA